MDSWHKKGDKTMAFDPRVTENNRIHLLNAMDDPLSEIENKKREMQLKSCYLPLFNMLMMKMRT